MTKKSLLPPPLLIMLLGLLFSVNAVAEEYSIKFDKKENLTAQTYFTFGDSKNLSDYYTGTYGGYTYSQGLKMERKTTVTFTTAKAATLTVVQSLAKNNDKTIKLDGTALLNRADNTTDKVGVFTVAIKEGSHTIAKGSGESGILYISVKELDANAVVQPVINAQWGASFGESTTVTITTVTEGAEIYYTTDGNEPTNASTKYAEPFKLNEACTVKAIALKDGLTNSEVATAAVTINNQRSISFDLNGYETVGQVVADAKVENKATYTLPNGRSYYVKGKTQTGWKDANDKSYALGAQVTVDKDYKFSPVFVDNSVALGDAATTVDWTFATEKGAPSVGYEGNVGYYAQQATINGTPLDVVMTVDTQTGAGVAGKRGKFNTTSATTRAQVNVGTVFIIPAIKGMTVTYTRTNETMTGEDVTFNGEKGTANEKGEYVSYTYNGNEAELKIIDLEGGFYPSGLKVEYPAASNEVNVSINKNVGYATMYYEKELKAPEGTKAYTAALNGNKLVLTELADGIIPAKTAVLVSGNGGAFEVSSTGASFSGQNDLKGTATAIETSTVTDGTVCTLAIVEGKTGFYKYTGNTLAANKAYIVVPATASAKSFAIVIADNATAISGVDENETENADATMYNIAGQRVDANAKGFVIVNGKKYIK